jgi:hypothetical protein
MKELQRRSVQRQRGQGTVTSSLALDTKRLCRIATQPSPRPVFVKEGQFEHLYIRTGNSTRLLTTKEAIDYCRSRWKTT